MIAGDAELIIDIANMPRVSIKFHRARWHRFTSLYACPAEWIEAAYFRLIEISPSRELDAFLASDQAAIKPYTELHHYRIFLDETGCHELYAESARAC